MGCRHWRYISSFHGPWLQLPPEILETIANANYNTPRPRPIDPAVFFDLVKIRRLVDEATNLAVRAASGVATIGQRGLTGAAHHAAALGLGFGQRPPPQTKLSPERRHRMREQATQKLVEAYRLDEIACSVATMQSASALEDVASLVLQRNPQDADAKYVHFFHEKIPSRQLVECTSLAPLDEIVAAKPSDPAPLRTRAMVRVFKGDYQGAVDDLTEALKLDRLSRLTHKGSRLETQLVLRQQPPPTNRRQPDVILKEEDQPSSLEMQLLFQRAGVYLGIACCHVAAALSVDSGAKKAHANGCATQAVETQPEPSPEEKEAQRRMVEARKLVRLNAKRALRDYMAFLAHFEYSPDLPIEVAEDFTRKVNSAVNGARAPRSQSYPSGPRSPLAGDSEAERTPHRIYALSELFASSPPSGLPPYPSTEPLPPTRALPPAAGPLQTTTETLTCHPLLTDGLHALLLCHCLIQTSPKELLRHAYMAARLARLADGYPVFQSSRCPARSDWIDVLRASGNWIQLPEAWEELCAPAPLALFESAGNGATPVPLLPAPRPTKALPAPGHDSAPATPDPPTAAPAEPDKESKALVRPQLALETPGDDRTAEEPFLCLAIRARQLRAERDYRLDSAVNALDAKLLRQALTGPSNDTTPPNPAGATPTTAPQAIKAEPAPLPSATTVSSNKTPAKFPSRAPAAAAATRRRATQAPIADEGREYPPASDRASIIARWVCEAPPPSAGDGSGGEGVRKRRKKPVKKTVGGLAGLGGKPDGGVGEGDGDGGDVSPD